MSSPLDPLAGAWKQLEELRRVVAALDGDSDPMPEALSASDLRRECRQLRDEVQALVSPVRPPQLVLLQGGRDDA